MSLGLLGFLRELVMDSGVPIHIIDTAGGFGKDRKLLLI